jgi:hypothetical protein
VTSILADENIPRATVMLLRKGRDGRLLRVGGYAGRERYSSARACSLRRTASSDVRPRFGELIFRRKHQPPPAVVYLRFVPATPEEPASVLRHLLHHDEIELKGRFTVVMRDQVRQRPLP